MRKFSIYKRICFHLKYFDKLCELRLKRANNAKERWTRNPKRGERSTSRKPSSSSSERAILASASMEKEWTSTAEVRANVHFSSFLWESRRSACKQLTNCEKYQPPIPNWKKTVIFTASLRSCPWREETSLMNLVCSSRNSGIKKSKKAISPQKADSAIKLYCLNLFIFYKNFESSSKKRSKKEGGEGFPLF